MRFLIYANDFYQTYKRGVANYGFNLINALKSNGHQVYIYSTSNIKLSKKQYKIYSNQVAITNELLKEIIYYGDYKPIIKSNFFIRIKKFFNYIQILFSNNELIKYQISKEQKIFIGNEFINWDGFYNDNLFKL